MSKKPWTEVIIDTRDYTVYRDDKSTVEGHLIFAPRKETWQNMVKCWEAVYKWGYDWIEREYCDGFDVKQTIGNINEEEIYPHVHLIPVRKNLLPLDKNLNNLYNTNT